MCCLRAKSTIRRSNIPGMDEDDGDYATLRELPLPPSSPQRLSNGEDTASEEGKVKNLFSLYSFSRKYFHSISCIVFPIILS